MAYKTPFEQKERDCLLRGCFRPSFASANASTPAGCLLQLIHGLDEGARDARREISERKGLLLKQGFLSKRFEPSKAAFRSRFVAAHLIDRTRFNARSL
jgi:hypothetical protein